MGRGGSSALRATSQGEVIIETAKTARVRVFVDGENISSRFSDAILQISRTFGEIEYARVYGAFAKIPKWRDLVAYAAVDSGDGKNATDILLSIHATAMGMETAPETIVIASSDGDFRHVAAFLQGRGIVVIGIGEKKAPEAFRKSCNRFYQIDLAAALTDPMPIRLEKGDVHSPSRLDAALMDIVPAGGLSMSQCVSLLRAMPEVAGSLPKNGVGGFIKAHSRVAVVIGNGSNLLVRLRQP